MKQIFDKLKHLLFGDQSAAALSYVVLRDIRDPSNTRFLSVTLNPNGSLHINGRDDGDEVERILGEPEYEWHWDIKQAEVTRFCTALGEPEHLMVAIKDRFSGDQSSELSSFLEEHGITYETWSRVGD